MGIEPFLVASSLICILAQRLVRVICPHCKEPYEPSGQELTWLNADKPPERLYRAKGCDKCMGKGYIGRTGIYELLEITPDVRTMIVERNDTQTLKTAALKSGFRTLQSNAVENILNGTTTIEEVMRVTQKDIDE
jgi:type II secretory ATPase GspE/PulE/Tfp pilus assembly ATPase PilB-like protein